MKIYRIEIAPVDEHLLFCTTSASSAVRLAEQWIKKNPLEYTSDMRVESVLYIGELEPKP